ncbi:translation factor [Meira miltonrushii]|uniref:Threonylcarbamoyl-AMP synthase n=1 Tax=Meira miltonrushii TaxID=1280837 RepID=A0A316VC41_9BASI|nr:translation factor [Meira miltonrushii]PWN35132.1 translation factor [Meira miltonrushii]
MSTSNGQLQDGKGYPDRTFTTRVLKIDGEKIKFTGKGKEPLRDVLVTIDDTGSEERISLIKASEALRKGHLVAFPTETVYGLAGNALDAEAATKIFRAKGRPVDNPLIVHISSLSMLNRLVPDSYELSPVYKTLLDAFWPGPLTLLFPADEEKVPSVVRCGLNSVGIRMPSHKVARALIATSNLPLAAPSANVSGKPSPTTAQHVYHDMTSSTKDEQGNEVVTGRIPYIVDGGSSDVGLESTVVDGITEPTELRVLRPGGVTVEAIEDALRQANLLQEEANGHTVTQSKVKVRVYGRDMAKDSKAEENPTTPGMKYRHYSPEAKVVVLLTSSTEPSSQQSASRVLAAKTVGESAARTLLTKNANTVIADEVKQFKLQTGKEHVHVGLMSMDDSKLTSSVVKNDSEAAESFMRSSKSFEDHTVYRFSLGASNSPNEAAHRLFDGLRTLDQGDANANRPSCDLIFVEAVADNFGVGLAIMNRLNKAASQTILINV